MQRAVIRSAIEAAEDAIGTVRTQPAARVAAIANVVVYALNEFAYENDQDVRCQAEMAIRAMKTDTQLVRQLVVEATQLGARGAFGD